MSAAFLILDLIGRNAGLKRERNARGSILPEFNDREEAVGQLALPLINSCAVQLFDRLASFYSLNAARMGY
jgi:hypothetical protein